MEAEGYQNRYSEKVLLTKYLPMYYYRPKISFDLKKEDLIKKNIYSCPQNLIKMHPDFDVVLKKDYRGGIIAPGVKISLDTLSDKASLIPQINLKKTLTHIQFY